MSIQIQFRRGTTAEHSTFTGAVGEITVDTTKDTAVVHDNSQVGGFALLREDGSNSALSDGSASAPSIKFSSSTTTGIYSPGTNQFAIATNGTGRLFVTSAGLVGINQASPGSALDVAGEIRIYPTSGTANLRFGSGGAEKGKVAIDSSSNCIIETAGSERLRIDSSGRLLVGTSSARTDFSAGTLVQLEGVGSGAARYAAISNNNLAADGSGFYFARSRGTADGSNTIVLNNDALGGIFFHGADGTDLASRAGSIQCEVDGTPGANDMPGRLVFSTTADGASSPTERMRIDSSGRLGVGTTSPDDVLHIQAASPVIRGVDSDNSGLAKVNFGSGNVTLDADVNNTAASSIINFKIDGTERARIDSSGRLLVGTSTARSNFYNGTGLSSTVQFETTHASPGTQGRFILSNNTSGGQSFEQIFLKSGADTTGSYALVSDNNRLGLISFQGTDGSEGIAAVSIEAYVDGTPGANDMPGRLVFSTTADGGTSPTERMRIDRSGNLQVSTGQFTVGTTATTGLQFINDGTFGTLHSADLIFRTASVERARIDTLGNLGVGTTDPGEKLHVNGNIRIGATKTTDDNADYSITSGGQLILHANDSATQDGNFAGLQLRAGISPNQSTINLFGSSNSSFQNIRFTVNSTERARIDSSGRLLVGTSTARSPQSHTPSIQVEGVGYAPSTVSIVGNDASVNGAYFFICKSRGTSVGSNTIVQNGDEIGSLDFLGADGTKLLRAARIQSFVDGTPGANDMPGRLVFSTTADGASSPTTRITLKSNGRCVFSTAPDTTISRSSGGTGPILTNSSSSIANAGIEIATDSTATRYCQIFTIATNVVGSITTSGSSTAYNTSSDYRLKENVTAVTDGITRLQQLKPSRFNFIADPDATVDGFIAHETQAVVPEAVTGEKDAVDEDGNPVYQGIDQSKLVPLLTAALQEAIGEIESLKARVAALEAS